jgi:hypothetical protein
MGRTSLHIRTQALFAVVLFLAMGASVFSLAPAQEKHAAVSVDKTKMGPYRALAHLAYASFEKGDSATASEIAQILERVWDKSEDYGGEMALSKTNPDLFKTIDKAMDDFITPLTSAAKNPPDAARMKAAYNAYLEKLKLAD